MHVAMLLAGLTIISGCSDTSHYFRYRMTVEVQTPQGLRTGSGVIEVRLRKGPFVGTAGYGEEARGEAVAVDLPGGQTIYAVLNRGGRSNYAPILPHRVFTNRIPEMVGTAQSPTPPEAQYDFLRTRRPVANLRPDEWPMLVRFGDPSNPRSAQTVTPGADGGIGSGVRVRRIWIEVTDDPVTEGIVRRLAWLPRQAGALVQDGRLHPENPAQDLIQRDFSTGIFLMDHFCSKPFWQWMHSIVEAVPHVSHDGVRDTR